MNSNLIIIISFVAMAWLLFIGCDNPTAPPAAQLVVSGYLIAGEDIDSIRVTETQPLQQVYSIAQAGISGADVRITVDGAELSLTEYLNAKGVYHYAGVHTVAIGKTYRLRIEHQGRIATAQTTVPGTIRYEIGTSASLTQMDTVTFLGPPITLVWTPTGKMQFVTAIASIDPNAKRIDRRYDDDEEDAEIKRATTLAFEGENLVDLPWLFFNYYGAHSVKIYAPDDAFYNFALTMQQDPQSLLSPLYNIEGGLGVFGSASVAELKVFVKEE